MRVRKLLRENASSSESQRNRQLYPSTRRKVVSKYQRLLRAAQAQEVHRRGQGAPGRRKDVRDPPGSLRDVRNAVDERRRSQGPGPGISPRPTQTRTRRCRHERRRVATATAEGPLLPTAAPACVFMGIFENANSQAASSRPRCWSSCLTWGPSRTPAHFRVRGTTHRTRQ